MPGRRLETEISIPCPADLRCSLPLRCVQQPALSLCSFFRSRGQTSLKTDQWIENDECDYGDVAAFQTYTARTACTLFELTDHRPCSLCHGNLDTAAVVADVGDDDSGGIDDDGDDVALRFFYLVGCHSCTFVRKRTSCKSVDKNIVFFVIALINKPQGDCHSLLERKTSRL
jgi:hypothetical protein